MLVNESPHLGLSAAQVSQQSGDLLSAFICSVGRGKVNDIIYT